MERTDVLQKTQRHLVRTTRFDGGINFANSGCRKILESLPPSARVTCAGYHWLVFLGGVLMIGCPGDATLRPDVVSVGGQGHTNGPAAAAPGDRGPVPADGPTAAFVHAARGAVLTYT